MNFNQLKEEAGKYSRAFKVFKDAEEFFQSLENVEQSEKELRQSILGLENIQNALITRNKEIGQMFMEAEEKAKNIVEIGNIEASKLREKALLVVENEKANLKDMMNDLDQVAAAISASKNVLAEVNAQINQRKSELSDLDKAKDQARKALGV